ncbi:General transcription factor II-I repeat domain-containing protein 1, partial [Cichlidogyrus casuarinus]
MFKGSDKPLALGPYREIMEKYCARIRNGFNIIPYSILSVNNVECSVTLTRDFIEQSLLDRIHTRPFISTIEKEWISYQILRSLEQLHGTSITINISESVHTQQLCHGDIKAENILITSWGWVMLVDPSPFKPVYLPADDPTLFTFFFDNSRRRACYLAPERLHKETESKPVAEMACDVINEMLVDHEGNQTLPETEPHEESPRVSVSSNFNPKAEFLHLTPAMDLFSLGYLLHSSITHNFDSSCVILEVYTDGIIPFSLSELLTYRGGDSSRLDRQISHLPNEHIKALLTSLLDRDPKKRKSAAAHLEEQRGKTFPELFYGPFSAFMQSYLLEDQSLDSERLAKLRETLPALFVESLQTEEERGQAALLALNIVTSALRPSTFGMPRALSTPITSATMDPDSCLRWQKKGSDRVPMLKSDAPTLSESAKMDAIVNCLILSEHLRVEWLVDRVIPYLFDLALAGNNAEEQFSTTPVTRQPHNSREVRTFALEAICELLRKCTNFLDTNCSFEGDLSPENEKSLNYLSDIAFLTAYVMPNFMVLSRAEQDLAIQFSLTKLLPIIVHYALCLRNKARRSFLQQQQNQNLQAQNNDKSSDFTDRSAHNSEFEFTLLENQIRDVFVKYFDYENL